MYADAVPSRQKPSFRAPRAPKERKPNFHLVSLSKALFPDEAERERFLEALLSGESREQAILIVHDAPAVRTFPRQGPLPWQPDFVVRLAEGFRPGKHPLYEKGALYPLDLSSAFAASAMLAIRNPVRRVLDLCAAPGGKAIFAWRAFHPEHLVANETMRKRTGSLIANLERCRIEGSAVGSADPSVWARKAPEAFDLVVVDAPCSGQSLLAKGDPAPGCFDPEMIDMCVGRQRRIVSHAATSVAPGGHLLYATCTYALKENEKVLAWLLAQREDLEAVEVPSQAANRSPHADFPCYRLYPHSGEGAGAFVALLRKRGETPALPELEGLPLFWRYGVPGKGVDLDS